MRGVSQGRAWLSAHSRKRLLEPVGTLERLCHTMDKEGLEFPGSRCLPIPNLPLRAGV